MKSAVMIDTVIIFLAINAGKQKSDILLLVSLTHLVFNAGFLLSHSNVVKTTDHCWYLSLLINART